MITKSEISLVRSLADKKSRNELSLFVVEGGKMVEEAISSGFTVEKIYATLDSASRFDGSIAVSGKDMERMSSFKSPSDVLALVRIEQGTTPHDIDSKLSIALDDIQDPGNLGTIIRLADWFGIENIICSEATADCFSPKVVQATVGAIFRVNVHYEPLAEFLSARSCPIFGTYLEGENIYNAELSRNGVIVMGNEGKGISKEIGATITRKLFIPPYPADREPSSESLNVAVATSVVCSEFRRRG